MEAYKKWLQDNGWTVESMRLRRTSAGEQFEASVVDASRDSLVEGEAAATSSALEERFKQTFNFKARFRVRAGKLNFALPVFAATPSTVSAIVRSFMDDQRIADVDYELSVSGGGSGFYIDVAMRRPVRTGITTLRCALDGILSAELDAAIAVNLRVHYDERAVCTECGQNNRAEIRLNQSRGPRGAMECYACVPKKAHERMQELLARVLGRTPSMGESVDGPMAKIVDAAERALFGPRTDAQVWHAAKRARQNVAADIAQGIFRGKLRARFEAGFEVCAYESDCRGCATAATNAAGEGRADYGGCTTHAPLIAERRQRVERALHEAWDSPKHAALRADAEAESKAIIEEMERYERYSSPMFILHPSETFTSKIVDHIALLDKAMVDAIMAPIIPPGTSITRLAPYPVLVFYSANDARAAFLEGSISKATYDEAVSSFMHGDRVFRAHAIVESTVRTDKVIDASARFFERMMQRDPHVDAAVEQRVALAKEAAELTDADMLALKEIATGATGDAKYIVATRRLLAASTLAGSRLLEQQNEIEGLCRTVRELQGSLEASAESAVRESRRAEAVAAVARTAIGTIRDIEKARGSGGGYEDTRADDMQLELDAACRR